MVFVIIDLYGGKVLPAKDWVRAATTKLDVSAAASMGALAVGCRVRQAAVLVSRFG